jgi:C-methyltransferase C-terminal domain/Putative zinc binding domain
MEPFYPLHVWICDKCFLVQLEEFVSPENIFSDYAYFSSYSDNRLDIYSAFCEQVKETKRKLLDFLIGARRDGKTVAGYGAPGKGNTLLNYCGIRTDFLDYTVDRNPHKQGKFLPDTHIPIFPPERIRQTRPDYLLILPWNLKNEIIEQNSFIREWGGRFVVPIPQVQVFA